MAGLWLFVAAMVASVSGDAYVWIGGNMDFTTTANWQNGFLPNSTNTPCSTTFGGNATIVSNVPAGQYNLGSVLNLPADGTLLLASDGTVLTFTDPTTAAATCNSQNAVWTGGLVPEERNDFYCHKNWASDIPTRPTATAVPCNGDSVRFEYTKTYKTTISPDTTLVVLNSITIDQSADTSITITSNSTAQLSLGLPQINMLSNPRALVYIGTRGQSDACIPMNSYDPVTFKCICMSSCPTVQMIIDADNRARQGILDNANRTLQAMNTYFVRNINGVMNAASLSVNQNQFGTALSNFDLAAFKSAIVEALVGLPATSVTITGITLASDNSTVTVTGSLNATAGNIFPIGFSSTSPPGNLVWTSTTSGIPNNVTRTQLLVQNTLSSLILTRFSEILSQQFNAQTATQTPDIQAIINAVVNSADPAATLTTLSDTTTTNCFTTCSSPCTACQNTLATTLTSASYPAANATDLASKVATAAGAQYSQTIATVTSLANIILSARSATNQAQQQQPRAYSLSSPELFIGRYSTQINQLRGISSENYNNLVQALSSSINNFQGVGDVRGLHFQYVEMVPGTMRRRRSVSQTPSALSVTFNYSATCNPSDTACQTAFTPSGSVGTLVQQRLDNTFNLFRFADPTCYVSGVPINSCLTAAATTACTAAYNSNGNDLTAARTVAYNTVYNLTACSGFPTFPNGTCLQSVDTGIIGDNAQTLTSNLLCGSSINNNGGGGTAASSSGSSGGSIIPIAAGAAGGGLLLLLLIVLLVMRRKRSSRQPTKKADDRTVVAFENPMYDDPGTSGGVAQPTYDAAAHHDNEGLYDEPAFNATAQKANPVYQSTEDLSAGYMEQVGGGGKGDGYLDVAPGGAEDVGYLDGVEKQ